MKSKKLGNELLALDRFDKSSSIRQKQVKQSDSYMKINGKLYDYETGEDISDKYQAPLLDIVKKKNEYYEKFIDNNDKIKMHTEENGGFIFALFNPNVKMIDRFQSLNKKDVARLLYLSTYVHYETGRLQKGDGTKITTDNIHDEIRLSKRRGKEYINKLIEEGIIKVDDKFIYVNPDIFYRGSIKDIKPIIKNMRYTRLFKDTVRQLFNDAKENELAHLSTIYSVLPYINLNHNYICHNPLEEDIEHIDTMSTAELAELLNYPSTSRLNGELRKLRVNEQPVFAFYDGVNNSRKKYMIVNPNVIYGGNNAEHLEVLKGMFVSYKETK